MLESILPPVFSNAADVFIKKLELHVNSQNELLKTKAKEIEDVIATISAESITPDGAIKFEVPIQDNMHEQTVKVLIQGLMKSSWRVEQQGQVLHVAYTQPPVQNHRGQ